MRYPELQITTTARRAVVRNFQGWPDYTSGCVRAGMQETQDGKIATGLLVPGGAVLGGLGGWGVSLTDAEKGAFNRSREWLFGKDDAKWHPGSVLVVLSIVALIGMQEATGRSVPFGGSAASSSDSPERADFCTDGSRHFTQARAALRRAVPAGWQSEAAGAFEAANQALMAGIQTMASLDLQMQSSVNRHADYVARTQFNLGMFQDALVAVLLIVLALEFADRWPVAWLLACVVCGAFLGAGGGELVNCDAHSKDAAADADGLDYGAVTAAAQQVIADYAAALPGSGVVSAGPTGAAAPGVASKSEAPRTSLRAPTGAGQPGVGADSPQITAPPDRPSVGPLVGVPTAMSKATKAALRPGGAAPPGNPDDQHPAAAADACLGHDDDGAPGLAIPVVEHAPVDAETLGAGRAARD